MRLRPSDDPADQIAIKRITAPKMGLKTSRRKLKTGFIFFLTVATAYLIFSASQRARGTSETLVSVGVDNGKKITLIFFSTCPGEMHISAHLIGNVFALGPDAPQCTSPFVDKKAQCDVADCFLELSLFFAEVKRLNDRYNAVNQVTI